MTITLTVGGESEDFATAYTIPLLSNSDFEFLQGDIAVARNSLETIEQVNSDDFLNACQSLEEDSLNDKIALFQNPSCDLTTAVGNLINAGAKGAIYLFGDGSTSPYDLYTRFAFNPATANDIPVMRMHGRDPSIVMGKLGCGDGESALPCRFEDGLDDLTSATVEMNDSMSPWLELYRSPGWWVLSACVLVFSAWAIQHSIRAILFLYSPGYRRRLMKGADSSAGLQRNLIVSKVLLLILVTATLQGIDFILSQIRDTIPAYIPEVIMQCILYAQFLLGIGALALIMFYWYEMLNKRTGGRITNLDEKNLRRFNIYMIVISVVVFGGVAYFTFFLPGFGIVRLLLSAFVGLQALGLSLAIIYQGFKILKRLSENSDLVASPKSESKKSREATRKLLPLTRFIMGIGFAVFVLTAISFAIALGGLDTNILGYSIAIVLIFLCNSTVVLMYLVTLSPLWLWTREQRQLKKSGGTAGSFSDEGITGNNGHPQNQEGSTSNLDLAVSVMIDGNEVDPAQ